MKKQDYDLLTRSNLSLACFEPVIKTYKNRVAEQTSSNISQIQERFYKELTYGPRASVIYVYAPNSGLRPSRKTCNLAIDSTLYSSNMFVDHIFHHYLVEKP